jgi:hypothetical protein
MPDMLALPFIIFLYFLIVTAYFYLTRNSKYKLIARINILCGMTLQIASIFIFRSILYIIGSIALVVGVFLGLYGSQDKIKSRAPIAIFISTFLLGQVIGYGFNINFLKYCIISGDNKIYPFAGMGIPIIVAGIASFLWYKFERKDQKAE